MKRARAVDSRCYPESELGMEQQAERGAGPTMNILDQALSVVQHVEASGGRISLNLDLDQPGHRAALAAALAVLKATGETSELLLAPDDSEALQDGPAAEPRRALVLGPALEGMEGDESEPEQEAAMRRDFTAAVAMLTNDVERQTAVVRDTYPRVRDLLRDGVNVEAVAQIQYRRWLEDNLDTVRRN